MKQYQKQVTKKGASLPDSEVLWWVNNNNPSDKLATTEVIELLTK